MYQKPTLNRAPKAGAHAEPVSFDDSSVNRIPLFNQMDMKAPNKKLLRFFMCLLLLGGMWQSSMAQLEGGEGPGGPGGSFTITGPTSANLNQSKTYTISGAGISSVSWIVSKGTITSSNNSSATVTWNQTGTGNIYALVTNTSNQTDPVEGVFVTITNPAPPVPPAASVSALNNCGVTTISRSNPPSGITWYWQGTNSSGTSTANSSVNYAVTTAGTYYLRARSSAGVWSTSSRGISATIDQVPGTPGSVSVSNNCGNTVLTRPNPPSGTTYYWQSSSSGISTSNSASSITRTSGSTYYLRARNNSSACWSTVRTVNYSVNAVPSTPPTPSVSNNCGNTVLTRANPPSGYTYYWQSSSSGTSTSNAASTVTRTSGSTYYLRSRNNSSGCWSSIRTVNYSVNAVPSTPPTPSVSNNCGNTVLTRANPASGYTYYWQSSSSGTSTSNSASTVTRTSGSIYYLRARNNSSGCWSPIRSVSYTVKTVPSTPPAPSISNNCGSTVLTRSSPGPETVFYWQSSASGTSTSNSASSITRTSGSTYYLRAYNTTSGCWSSARTISYSINTPPSTPPEVIIGNNCGNTDLIRSTPPSGITYYWQSSSTGTSTSNSATTLNRTSGTAYYLRARNNSTNCWSGARTISYSIDQAPATPPSPSVSNNCGNTVLTRTNPASGFTYYWQSSASGVSTSNAASSVTRTSGSSYYLRARNNTTHCWSPSRTVNYSINTAPATPPSPSLSNNCGNTVLTRTNPASGYTYYWQSSSTGTSTSNSSSSITRTSGSTYYLRARNNSTGCWSAIRSVSYSINAAPSTPPTPSISNNCGNTVLTRANPASGYTYYWQSSSSGTSTSNSASTVTRTSGSTYYLRARNNSTGCWSIIRTVNYSINAAPSTPPTPSVSNNCGNTVLTRANPASGYTYYWQSSSTGTSTSNSASTVTRNSGSTYYLRARNNSTGCWSAIRAVSYMINSAPGAPPAPTVTNNCGSTVLTRSSPGPETAYYWQSSASGISTSNSASSVTRTSGSTYYLRAYNTTTGCWSSPRTISYSINTPPSTPPEVIIGNNCGNTDLIRPNPPTGVTYYWQSSLTGISTANSAATLNRTSGTTYYLRARNNSTNCWGAARTISYSIDAAPATPPSPSISNNCGNTVLTRSNPASGFTYYWQSSSTGTSTSNAASSVTRNSGSTYYLRARNNTTHCWSPIRTISYSINTLPVQPATPTVTENCNNTVLTRPNPPTGITYYWQSSNTGVSTSSSASTANRSSAGTYYLRGRNNTTQCWGTAVAVSYGFKALPATPATPSIAENCGNTVLTRANPPSGYTYYWQSSGSGTSTANSASTVNRPSAGTYYLRARNNSTLCWSSVRSVSYGFKTLPATPAAPSIAENCGVTVLTRANPPSGFTYYWQSTGSGVSTANAFSSINLFSAGTYYLRARNNSTQCWGVAVAVSYGLKALPSAPPTPTVTENCNNTVLTRANPPSGVTYYWQSTLSGESTSNSVSTVNRSSAGTYYLRARNNSTECWGAATLVGYGFKALPATPPVPTVAENCDNTVLTRANPPSGFTYYWQSSNTGISTSNSASTINHSSAGTYYLRARNNSTQCWGTAVAVAYGFKALPTAPPVPSVAENCNNTVLTRANPASGITYFWQSTLSGVSTSNSASTINRSSAGTYYLRGRNNTTQCWGTATAVSYGFNALPATPPAPTAVENCGNTVLTRANPPSGFTYFWQSSSSGTSTANSSSTLNQLSGGTYYLRARNNATQCWGVSSSVSYSFNATPAPAAPAVIRNFGSTILSRSTPPSGVTWYWQGTNASGTVTNNTSVNYTVTTAGTYYLRSKTAANCWGPSVAVTATIENQPQILVTGDTQLSGLGDKTTLSAVGVYTTYAWKKGGVLVGTGSSFEAHESGSYTLTVTKSGVSGSGVSTAVVVTGNANIDPGDHNYVISTSVLTSGITTEAEVKRLSSDDRTVAISYLDGLGRPTQSIGVEASPGKQHIVQPTTYDVFGRQTKSYLPYTVAASSNTYQVNPVGTGAADYTSSAQYLFYQNAVDVAHDTAPYAESILENSPGGRVLKQGAPGVSWQPVAGSFTDKVIRSSLEFNEANTVRLYTIAGGFPVPGAAGAYYPVGTLVTSVTSDEDGNEVIQHTDKAGRVVLKQVYTGDSGNPWADTYYVYDDYGNLRVVLPPEASKAVAAGNLSQVPTGYTLVSSDLVITTANYTGGSYMYLDGVSVTVDPAVTLSSGAEIIRYGIEQDFLNKWAFQYQYDHRQRMTAKRVPDTDWVYMVYDPLDRLVLTQDANQRSNHEWLFTKYDLFSRPILTGIYQHGSSQSQESIQEAIDVFYETNELHESIGTIVLGYTNNAFPIVGNIESYLTASYYDDYTNLPSDFAFNYIDDLGNGAKNENVKGRVVGNKVKILDGSDLWLKSTNYYDKRYLLIQTQEENHLGGTNIQTSKYNFSGRISDTKSIHDNGNSGADVTITQAFNYDHVGRLQEVLHKTNEGPLVLLAKSEYNELGRLIDKKLHSVDGGATFEQSVDYRYNIRGWLSNINNPNLSDGEGDYFGLRLFYEQSFSAIGSTPKYNGNISVIGFSDYSSGLARKRSYSYGYDAMNRLKEADYVEYDSGSGWAIKTEFSVDDLTYDLNGNIQSLRRYADNTTTAMDDLSYSYVGNQLQSVLDAGDISEGFKDGNASGVDYTYDANGNMISDANKDITDIAYNHLNLPQRVNFTDGRSISYVYDATGIKLSKITDDNGALAQQDYDHGFIYEDNVLKQIGHSEGRIRKKDNGAFVYDYYLKDHLGNTRITFTTENEQVVYLATMETEYAGFEEGVFLNVDDSRAHSVAGNYTLDNTIVADEVSLLNAGARIGPGKMLTVRVGDQVDMEVYAYHFGNYVNSGSVSPSVLAGAVATAFGGLNGGSVEQQGVYNLFDNNAAALLIGESGQSSAPRAYLNYILFDSEFNFVDAGFDQAGSADNVHHQLSLSKNITGNGYLYVYLSNESQTNYGVYFDDLRVTHVKGKVLQEDHNYPFGMSIKEFSSSTPLVDGMLKGDEFGLGLNDLGFRQYDPIIGRFVSIDPLSELSIAYSGYHFAKNEPVRNIDVLGLYSNFDDEEDIGPGNKKPKKPKKKKRRGRGRVSTKKKHQTQAYNEIGGGGKKGRSRSRRNKPKNKNKDKDKDSEGGKKSSGKKTKSSDGNRQRPINASSMSIKLYRLLRDVDAEGVDIQIDVPAASLPPAVSNFNPTFLSGAENGSLPSVVSENNFSDGDNPTFLSEVYEAFDGQGLLTQADLDNRIDSYGVELQAKVPYTEYLALTRLNKHLNNKAPRSVQGNFSNDTEEKTKSNLGTDVTFKVSIHDSGSGGTELGENEEVEGPNDPSITLTSGQYQYAFKGFKVVFARNSEGKLVLNSIQRRPAAGPVQLGPLLMAINEASKVFENSINESSSYNNNGEKGFENTAAAKTAVLAAAEAARVYLAQLKLDLDAHEEVDDFVGIDEDNPGERELLRQAINNQKTSFNLDVKVTIVDRDTFLDIKESFKPDEDTHILIGWDKQNDQHLFELYKQSNFMTYPVTRINTETGLTESVNLYSPGDVDATMEYYMRQAVADPNDILGLIKKPEASLNILERIAAVAIVTKEVLSNLRIDDKYWDESLNANTLPLFIPDPAAGIANTLIDQVKDVPLMISYALSMFDANERAELTAMLSDLDFRQALKGMITGLTADYEDPNRVVYRASSDGTLVAVTVLTGGASLASKIKKMLTDTKKLKIVDFQQIDLPELKKRHLAEELKKPEFDGARQAIAGEPGLAKGWDILDVAELNKLKNNGPYLGVVTDYSNGILARKLDNFGLKIEEEAIIRHYTGGSHEQLNKALDGLEAMTEELAEYKNLLNDALSKLPDHVDDVFRGLSQTESAIAKNWNVGQVVTQSKFVSSSKLVGTADNFMLSGNGDVRLLIKSKTGKVIESVSIHSNEAEVLFKSGKQFEVLNKYPIQLDTDQIITEIVLKEL